MSGSDAFEMEITEDMIEFFSKSQAHRKERGKLALIFQYSIIPKFWAPENIAVI